MAATHQDVALFSPKYCCIIGYEVVSDCGAEEAGSIMDSGSVERVSMQKDIIELAQRRTLLKAKIGWRQRQNPVPVVV